MALILPKGIVVNSPGVSGDILQRATKPLTNDQIQRFWQVYTTTKRRLVDPTAERLENLFWRIWGSRHVRQPSSIAAAQLFMDISNGNTYPGLGILKSPVARDESGVPSKILLPRPPPVHVNVPAPQPRLAEKVSSLRPPKSSLGSKNPHTIRVAADGLNGHTPGGTPANPSSVGSLAKTATPDVSQYIEYPSSIKSSSPMPPPILKKSRGQSSTGPKPTARFISPGISEDEEDETAVEVDSDAQNSHVVVRPPTPPRLVEPGAPEELVNQSKKKTRTSVHATLGGRKRPGVRRRPSSQSSTGSDQSVHREDDLVDGAAASSSESKATAAMPRAQENESAQENRHVLRATGRLRPAKTKLGKLGAARKSVIGERGKDAATKTNEDGDASQVREPGPSSGASKLHQMEITPQESPSDNTNRNKINLDESRLQEYLFSEAEAALRAQKVAEEAELDRQSKKLSSSSRRAMSAHNISAAYRSTGRSESEGAATAEPTLGLAKAHLDLQNDGLYPSIDESEEKAKQLPAKAQPLARPVSSSSSKPFATGLFTSSFQRTPALPDLAPSRSVSNLTNLLKKDDEMKARKERKGFSDRH